MMNLRIKRFGLISDSLSVVTEACSQIRAYTRLSNGFPAVDTVLAKLANLF